MHASIVSDTSLPHSGHFISAITSSNINYIFFNKKVIHHFSAVSTFAWYTASAATTVNNVDATNNALTTSASSTNLGSFTVTVTLGTPSPTTIGLSDDDGNTFVYATGQVAAGKEIAASHANLHSSLAVGLTLSYTGTLATDAEKDLAWQASAAEVTVTITDATEGLASGEGLKFFKDSAPTKAADGYKGASSVTWTVSQATMKTLQFATTTKLSLSVGTLYVAAKGVNGLDQSAGHTYVINADI